MAFDLSNYVTVAQRITEAKKLYPNGRFVSEIVTVPEPHTGKYIAVRAHFYRDADDPTPASGLAWKLVPGPTPYTLNSELQNAETSAWGRALVAAFVADTTKGIASRDEVEEHKPPTQKQKTKTVPLVKPNTAVRKRVLEFAHGDPELAKVWWADAASTLGKGPDDELDPGESDTVLAFAADMAADQAQLEMGGG